jgi:Acetyltransferase (GNAT) domain
MNIEVELLSPGREAQYEELLHSVDSSLFYASLAYRQFLRTVLAESCDRYLIALQHGRVIGALPSFVKYSSRHGNVLNSLPFYGSNGGITVAPSLAQRETVKSALTDAFISLAAEEKLVTSTLISNPLQDDEEFYRAHTGATLCDERVGQVTPLPILSGDEGHIEAHLMALFHQKTRNSIRKAQKSEIVVSHSGSAAALATLADIHQQNMAAINGPAKDASVFQAIRENFKYDQDYRIYLAEKDGTIIAALLVFFFHRTVEYYTPVTLEEYRLFQPMSLLIFEAMKEAVRSDLRYWNWGGPGPVQPGIYNFKKRWGAVDRPYYYYTRVFDESVRGYSKEILLAEYPYFYVIPFRALRSEGTQGQAE